MKQHGAGFEPLRLHHEDGCALAGCALNLSQAGSAAVADGHHWSGRRGASQLVASGGLPGSLTAKLTANRIDARRNRGTAADPCSTAELHGRTAPDRQESPARIRNSCVKACIGLAVPGRPIDRFLVAEDRSAGGVRDRTGPEPFGPRWVRGAPGPQGHEWSPTVTAGSEEPQIAQPPAQAARMTPASGSDCGPEGQERIPTRRLPRRLRRLICPGWGCPGRGRVSWTTSRVHTGSVWFLRAPLEVVRSWCTFMVGEPSSWPSGLVGWTRAG
jgi:hypothetical protein